ncbi:MAG: GHKL domain-containing protein [Cyclobacteriaceae bacterium]|nr:GHKL domain-containing protein [Cyclobacteriaceae bacterium]
MTLSELIRTILIGKDKYISVKSAYKSAMLRGQLALIAFVIGLAYAFIDWYNGINGFISYYFGLMIICVIAIILNRKEKYRTANFLLLSAANFLIYVFSANDTYRAGTYIYFIISGLMALALFGYKHRYLAILFCFLSLALFILSYVYQIKILILTPEQQKMVYAEDYVRTTFIINFIMGLTVCVLIFFFLLNINHHSEKEILMKNELLSKTNQELDRFVYSASHDLKAPLSSMLGLIEIAQRTDDPNEVKACLEMMKGRVKNLDEFILEIINYSRNSRLDLHKEPVDLFELTKEVVDNLKYAEGFEQIYFKYNFPPDLKIKTDRGRLRVVLNNLISNSLKYHDSSKDNQVVEVNAYQESNFLKMMVKDNGIGIAAEHQTKIFEMFYRASEKSKGSGLGLYIVQETIHKMNGKIKVASDVGVGTSFEIEVPV